MKKTIQTIERNLEVVAITTDGRGVARPQGGTVLFIDGALPGELVDAKVTREKRSFREAVLVNIARASQQRVTPPCPHYESCGGCNLQHASLRAQQQFKEQWLFETLRKLGGWPQEHLTLAQSVFQFTSGDCEHYRQRIRIHCNGKYVGFRSRGSHSIVNIATCLTAHKRICENWENFRKQIVEDFAKTGCAEYEITAFENGNCLEPVTGRERTHRESSAEQKYFRVAHPFVPEFRIHRQSFIQPHKNAASVYITHIVTAIDNFLQKNKTSSVLAWDLYAGSGPFSMLPSIVATKLQVPCKTIAVEGVGPASEALKINTKPWDVLSVTSDVGEFCATHAGDKPNVVVLDPPRCGAGVSVMKSIVNACSATSLVIYVACDAASLARDTRVLLDTNFQLESLTLYDMFAHTNHYETIAIFQRRLS